MKSHPEWFICAALAFCLGCQRQMPPDRAPEYVTFMKIRESLGSATGGAAASTSQSDQKPTGWATLSGVFRVTGSVPSRRSMNVTKELDICAPGGQIPLAETLIVSGDGGIKNIVIYLTSKIQPEEPWTHPSAMPAEGEVVFDQKRCLFLTHVLALNTGQTLIFRNSDPTGHNIKMAPKNNMQLNQTVPATGQMPHQFVSAEREPFSVTCSIHPWMEAWILTRDNGYFAVTKEDGSFEISNLPAPVELEFRVWQEKSRFLQDVSVNNSPTRWSKGRFKLSLDPNDEAANRLDVSIDASVFK